MLGHAGVEVNERRFFKDLPTAAEVKALAALAPGGVADLVSTRGRRYKELGLGERTLTDAEWIDLLVREPGLWRRPVAVSGNRLVIGYEPAALQGLVGAN